MYKYDQTLISMRVGFVLIRVVHPYSFPSISLIHVLEEASGIEHLRSNTDLMA